jgi:Spy/CpxP family protein refolding chaperone
VKKTVIILILTLGAVGTMAQEESRPGMHRGPHGNPEQRIERMRQHLGLSDDQVVQMQEIQASDASREEKREQMRSVLTEEQRNMIREHRLQKGGKRHGRQGETPEQSKH